MPNTFLSSTVMSTYDNNLIAKDKDNLLLRYDYNLKALPLEAELLFDNVTFRALKDLWTIRPFVENMDDISDDFYAGITQEYGSVDAQLSTDNGVTWLFWDTNLLSWQPINANQFTTFKDINENLDTIPFGVYRQLRLKVRLKSGISTTIGPRISGVLLGYSLIDYTHAEDIPRSIKKFLDENLKIEMRLLYTSNGFTSIDLDHPTTALEIISAYNITQDPTRSTNLYDGLGVIDNVFNLLVAPQINDIIEVTWIATVDVTLAFEDTDFEDETVRHVPKIIVDVQAAGHKDTARQSQTYGRYLINYATKHYWNEAPALLPDYRALVYAIAADESLAIKLVDATYGLLFSRANDGTGLRMVLSGCDADLGFFTPPFNSATDSSQSVSVKQFTFLLYNREWLALKAEGPLAQQHVILLEE